MKIEVLPDAVAVARRAAWLIAGTIGSAIAKRGQSALALSGGHTPWLMLTFLAALAAPQCET